MTKNTNAPGGAAQAEELAKNGREGKSPNASGGAADSDTEDYIPSVNDPEATHIPTSSMPSPESAHPDSPNSAQKHC